MNDIGKRFWATIAGIAAAVAVPSVALWIVVRAIDGTDSRMGLLVYVFLAALAGLYIGGVVSGLLQPTSTRRFVISLLTGPGLWLCGGLFIADRLRGGIIPTSPASSPLWPAILVGISCAGAFHGMHMKEKIGKPRRPTSASNTTALPRRS